MSRLSIVVIVAALGLAGCGASTKITSSWTAPDARPVRFAKVVVVFMNSAESTRRIAEDYLVDYIGSDRAVASHTLISQDEVQDTEAARATLEAENFDGAVVMRIIGSGEQIAYEPSAGYPASYGQFWGYYGYGWPTVYQPGYLRTDTVVNVETFVYSVDEDRLLWAGLSESFNPTDVEKAVDGIAEAVSRELRREGLTTN